MGTNLLYFLAIAACILTFLVLMVGIGSFSKGGEFNKKYANKIMRLRLLMQFIAVLLIVAFSYFASR